MMASFRFLFHFCICILMRSALGLYNAYGIRDRPGCSAAALQRLKWVHDFSMARTQYGMYAQVMHFAASRIPDPGVSRMQPNSVP